MVNILPRAPARKVKESTKPEAVPTLAKQTAANDAVAGGPVEQDAAFLDVDEAEVETPDTDAASDSDDSENDQHLFSDQR